jgi:alcohol dehydrogenase
LLNSQQVVMEQITYVAPGQVEIREAEAPQLRASGEAIVRPIAVGTCDLDAALVRGATPWQGPLFQAGR